jgi:hypothetical protein
MQTRLRCSWFVALFLLPSLGQAEKPRTDAPSPELFQDRTETRVIRGTRFVISRRGSKEDGTTRIEAITRRGDRAFRQIVRSGVLKASHEEVRLAGQLPWAEPARVSNWASHIPSLGANPAAVRRAEIARRKAEAAQQEP